MALLLNHVLGSSKSPPSTEWQQVVVIGTASRYTDPRLGSRAAVGFLLLSRVRVKPESWFESTIIGTSTDPSSEAIAGS